MSPSKSRTQFVPARPRSEVITAVVVSGSIVVGTALLIWLMRPGKVGVAGGGGLFTRQPRATMLVVITLAALAVVVTRVLRGRRRSSARLSERGAILVGVGVVVVLAVVGGIFWPGGVVRHFPKAPTLAVPPTTNSIPASASTTPASTTPASTTPASTTAAASTSPTTTG